MHGNLSEINQIPFEAPPMSPAPAGFDPRTQVVGVGYTPEGLDQNTACKPLDTTRIVRTRRPRSTTAQSEACMLDPPSSCPVARTFSVGVVIVLTRSRLVPSLPPL